MNTATCILLIAVIFGFTNASDIKQALLKDDDKKSLQKLTDEVDKALNEGLIPFLNPQEYKQRQKDMEEHREILENCIKAVELAKSSKDEGKEAVTQCVSSLTIFTLGGDEDDELTFRQRVYNTVAIWGNHLFKALRPEFPKDPDPAVSYLGWKLGLYLDNVVYLMSQGLADVNEDRLDLFVVDHEPLSNMLAVIERASLLICAIQEDAKCFEFLQSCIRLSLAMNGKQTELRVGYLKAYETAFKYIKVLGIKSDKFDVIAPETFMVPANLLKQPELKSIDDYGENLAPTVQLINALKGLLVEPTEKQDFYIALQNLVLLTGLVVKDDSFYQERLKVQEKPLFLWLEAFKKFFASPCRFHRDEEIRSWFLHQFKRKLINKIIDCAVDLGRAGEKNSLLLNTDISLWDVTLKHLAPLFLSLNPEKEEYSEILENEHVKRSSAFKPLFGAMFGIGWLTDYREPLRETKPDLDQY